MKRLFAFKIDEELYAQLRQAAFEKKTSMGQIARAGIEIIIKENSRRN